MVASTALAGDFIPTAKVIADSLSPAGNRLTTIEVRLHRFVLAELNTHRAFSRSSASSRAVPVAATLRRLAYAPVLPLSWPTEAPGMTGGAELPPAKALEARRWWLTARDDAVRHAHTLAALGVHKSVINRLLEPFISHTVIVSATDWTNFFDQRCAPTAQPEIRAVAEAMRDTRAASTPAPVTVGCWHLPYVTDAEREDHPIYLLRQVSAARCARVSYLHHDGNADLTADLRLYAKLVSVTPPHVAPLEHVATPVLPEAHDTPGNFTGWLQLRHIVHTAPVTRDA